MTSNLIMDGSSLEESAATTIHSSIKSAYLPHAHLQRMGSGESVVLDAADGQQDPLPALSFRNCTVAAATDTVESRKLPSSQYKGVVPQPNGRWGAQIYEKHHRVWLGTFDSEAQAAAAYDVAACRFRARDAVTNFAPIDDEAELDFIRSRSKAEIVDMLRKHTYRDELRHSRRSASRGGQKRRCAAAGGAERERLFEKTVTPSDVGKLNRLVIPKQHAEKHFPLKSGSLLLSFEDERGKVWRFRYSYWNSSQSYVLTKGWSRFVKEKGLRAGGVVIFRRSMAGPDRQLYIECGPGGEPAADLAGSPPVQMIRLFGVNMFQVAARRPEMELFPVESGELCKRQCVRV